MSLNRVRGTEDLKDELQLKHNWIIKIARKIASQFCFKELSTPILENTDIFLRSLGENSDIVTKEMFTFKTKSNSDISLRPEGTAGVARHFLTEKLHQSLPLRFFYQGPMFRYERPQKGRLRQFHTVGVELLGESDPRGDIECISLACLYLKKLNIQQTITLEINSIGDKESREQHKKALIDYLTPLKNKLSEDSHKRLNKNPLRILDSKEIQDIELLKESPKIQNFLNPQSKQFFKDILNGLDALKIPYKINPFLVRGLDYYNHCVFEFKSDSKQMGAQNTILAGGRYDNLIQTISKGEDCVHGVGWSAGIERLCFLINSPSTLKRPISLVSLGKDAEQLSQKLGWELRLAGFTVFHPRATGNLSKKIKRSIQMKAKYALIFGPEEIKKNILSVKDLDQQSQVSVDINKVTSYFMDKNINDIS